MWDKSMKGLSSLIRRTTPSCFAYFCEKNGGSLSDKGCLLWDHLVLILMIRRCFCHLQKSLLGHVMTSTNQLQQNWLERTISFILGKLVVISFVMCNLKIMYSDNFIFESLST